MPPFSFFQHFSERPALIAMIHVPALPGTPNYNGDWPVVIQQVKREAAIYQAAGVDALILENMHDTPYLAREVGPEIVSSMTAAALAVKAVAPDLVCGIQVLAGANQAALAVALAAGCQFIRAEAFVFGHVADEGWMNSDAGKLLRYRKQIDASHIAVYTDIKKKHSAHQLTADVSLAETAKAAHFFRADGVIVTGTATGAPAKTADLKAVKEACPEIPVFIGSGVNTQNLKKYTAYADGLIVGSSLKTGNHWANPIDENKLADLLSNLDTVRS
ncbi:MAG: BtpA/SgcQ family protein [Bacteroidota bacterium]